MSTNKEIILSLIDKTNDGSLIWSHKLVRNYDVYTAKLNSVVMEFTRNNEFLFNKYELECDQMKITNWLYLRKLYQAISERFNADKEKLQKNLLEELNKTDNQ